MKKETTLLIQGQKNRRDFFCDQVLPKNPTQASESLPGVSPLAGMLGQLQDRAKQGNRAGFILIQRHLQRWVRQFPQSPTEGAELCLKIEGLEAELLHNTVGRYYRASEHFTAEARQALQSRDLHASNAAMKKARKLLEEAEAIRRSLNLRATREADTWLEMRGLGEYHS